MAAEQKKVRHLYSVGELLALPKKEFTWVVDGWVRAQGQRVTIITGAPDAGKSTLMRQLAVAVSKGADFLGRKTKRSEVIYFTTEDDPEDVADSFKSQGYRAGDDAMIFVSDGREDNKMTTLRKDLDEHPSVNLVFVEMMDDLLQIPDINKNTACREAFERFDKIMGPEIRERVAFVMIVHDKKTDGTQRGHKILGGTVIRGKTGTKFYMDGEGDAQRILSVSVRRGGTALPEWNLEWNKAIETCTLGERCADARTRGKEETKSIILKQIEQSLTTTPNVSRKACLEHVSGNEPTKRQVFDEAVRTGKIVLTGKSAKGAGKLYSLATLQPIFEQLGGFPKAASAPPLAA